MFKSIGKKTKILITIGLVVVLAIIGVIVKLMLSLVGAVVSFGLIVLQFVLGTIAIVTVLVIARSLVIKYLPLKARYIKSKNGKVVLDIRTKQEKRDAENNIENVNYSQDN